METGFHLPTAGPREMAAQRVITSYLGARAFETIREERQLSYAPSIYVRHYSDTSRIALSIEVSQKYNLLEVQDILDRLVSELGQLRSDTLESAIREVRSDLVANDARDLGQAMELAWLMRRAGHSPADLQEAVQGLQSGDVARYAADHFLESNRFTLANARLSRGPLWVLVMGIVFSILLIDGLRGFPWVHGLRRSLAAWLPRKRQRSEREAPPAKPKPQKVVPVGGDELEREFQKYFRQRDKEE